MSNIKSRWRLGINILFSCVFTETVDKWAWPCRRNSRQSPQLGSWRRRHAVLLGSPVRLTYMGGMVEAEGTCHHLHFSPGFHWSVDTSWPSYWYVQCPSYSLSEPPPRRSQAADSAQTRWWPGGPAQTCQPCLTRFGKENTRKTTTNTFSLKSTFL